MVTDCQSSGWSHNPPVSIENQTVQQSGSQLTSRATIYHSRIPGVNGSIWELETFRRKPRFSTVLWIEIWDILWAGNEAFIRDWPHRGLHYQPPSSSFPHGNAVFPSWIKSCSSMRIFRTWNEKGRKKLISSIVYIRWDAEMWHDFKKARSEQAQRIRKHIELCCQVISSFLFHF